MFKNVANQKVIVFAYDATTNLPKTGDAANITAYVAKDYGSTTVLGDTSATEQDATNAKGYYLFDLTQAETNANTLHFSAKSATANIVVVGAPAVVFTRPANASIMAIDGSGQVTVGACAAGAINAAAIADAAIDLATFAADSLPLWAIAAMGTAQGGSATTLQLAAATNFGADNVPNQMGVFIYAGTGAGQARPIDSYVNATDTATVSPAWTTNPDATSKYITFAIPQVSTAALPAVNVTQMNGVNVTSAGGRMEVNITHCNGVAIPSAAGRAEVNTTHLAGTSQTGADLGLSVAAIKVQTDKFTFTVANRCDVNVRAVNGVTVQGAGTGVSPWGP